LDYLLLVFITAACISLFSIPALIKVAILKRLFDAPDGERKVHNRIVPTVGGIIIFAATLFSYALWYPVVDAHDLKYIAATSLLLFFVGIKDDIIGTAPVKKLLSFIIISFILVLLANQRITTMHGIFGVYAMTDAWQILFSTFTVIVIINAFNLIDGIDGLAAGIGLIACLTLGAWFYLVQDASMAALAFALAGSLAAFLVFNFAPAKLFMGDSGSLIIGLIVAILVIRCLSFDVSKIQHNELVTFSRPVFVLSILVYPLYDTFRVFVLRILRGESPFTADKKHIHHALLSLGFSHAKTTLILYAFTLIIISIGLLLHAQSTLIQFVSVLLATIVIAQIPFFIKRRNA
jgi:UDP-GlcNAc:undecaprenyl-phosphate/decaprenyl-phosphate GlcNAc-1-phosphate transferase